MDAYFKLSFTCAFYTFLFIHLHKKLWMKNIFFLSSFFFELKKYYWLSSILRLQRVVVTQSSLLFNSLWCLWCRFPFYIDLANEIERWLIDLKSRRFYRVCVIVETIIGENTRLECRFKVSIITCVQKSLLSAKQSLKLNLSSINLHDAITLKITNSKHANSDVSLQMLDVFLRFFLE